MTTTPPEGAVIVAFLSASTTEEPPSIAIVILPEASSTSDERPQVSEMLMPATTDLVVPTCSEAETLFHLARLCHLAPTEAASLAIHVCAACVNGSIVLCTRNPRYSGSGPVGPVFG